VKEIAEAAEITERYAYRLLRDLQKAGYVRRIRNGRRNHYRLNPDLPLGDPVVEERSLRELLRLIVRTDSHDLIAALSPTRGPRMNDRSMNDRSLVVARERP